MIVKSLVNDLDGFLRRNAIEINTPDHTDASMYQSCIHWQDLFLNKLLNDLPLTSDFFIQLVFCKVSDTGCTADKRQLIASECTIMFCRSENIQFRFDQKQCHRHAKT